jgi:predicted kinase
MRKWMRERLKRRKKEPEKAQAEIAPAPLQPAFYDTKPEKEAAPAVEPANIEEPEPEVAGSAAPGVAAPQGGNGVRRRRRRGRGGRNRGGARPVQTAQAVSPENAPLTPTLDQPAEPAQVPAAPPRPPKGIVVLSIGLPGSGKSAWFKRHNITPLSSDMLRALLFDDATEQRFQDLIFSNLRSMLKARLIARRPMNYVDATNLTPHERHSWIKLAKDYGYEVQAVFFDVPVETCLERNQKRDRVVPEDVMRRMAGKLKAPTFDEGFAKITVVRVKQKE